jgi:peroxiredoxin Q/BCP
MRFPLAAAAVLLSALALHEPAQDASTLPEVGKPAPAFRLNDHEGAAVAVGGAAQRWRVLAFYPKAATPG